MPRLTLDPSPVALRDRQHYPLSLVFNLDRPGDPPRQIRLPPRLAVLFAAQNAFAISVEEAEQLLIATNTGWICGCWTVTR